MMDSDSALLKYEWTALTPPRQLRDEVGRRRQLNVDAQALLQRWQLAQQLICFRLEAKINIYRGVAPAFLHRCRATCQVDPYRPASATPKLPGKRPDALRVNGRTHARPRAQS